MKGSRSNSWLIKFVKNFNKTIILSNADIISDIDYYEMLNYHNKKINDNRKRKNH